MNLLVIDFDSKMTTPSIIYKFKINNYITKGWLYGGFVKHGEHHIREVKQQQQGSAAFKSNNGASGARPSGAYLVPVALVVDPQGYSDRRPAQITEVATVLAQAIDAIVRVAEHFSTYGVHADLTRVTILLAELTEMKGVQCSVSQNFLQS
jgi:hypothetical protein